MIIGTDEYSLYSITQEGRNFETQLAGRGLPGRILSAMIDCGGVVTVDRLVSETGLDRRVLRNVLERLQSHRYVSGQG